jgi:hypothetical protein
LAIVPKSGQLRPAVVNRKSCGGNRSWNGAHSQAVLMSILRTCHQHHLDPLRTRLLQTPGIPPQDLLPAPP